MINSATIRIARKGRAAVYNFTTGLLNRKLEINRFKPTGGVE